MLNEILSKNFNNDFPPLSESDCKQFTADPSSLPPESILCTEQVVFNLLTGVDTSKLLVLMGFPSKCSEGLHAVLLAP